jgi:8-hydroxy-5-deazaflavin:NADPH oxidoreductase
LEITIIGAGDMAHAIAGRLVTRRRVITLANRTLAKAEQLASTLVVGGADPESIRVVALSSPIRKGIVVLAVPYEAALALAEQRRPEMTGSVVVDLTNPVDWNTMDALVTPAESSAAEEIARRLGTDSRVLKAFNTTFARRLLRAPAAFHPLDLFIAGDDAEAKGTFGDLVAGTGLRVVDVGPLRRARELESLGFLHITLQSRLGTGFETAIELAA